MRTSSADLESQLEKVRDLESRLTFRMAVVSKLLDQQANDLLKGSSISLTAYRVLNIVNTFGQISISDISRFTAMDRAQISRTARDLEQRGYVTFTDDAHSKRKKMALLTPKGRALIEELLPRFAARQKQVRDTLGPEAYDALWRGLTKLSDMFD